MQNFVLWPITIVAGGIMCVLNYHISAVMKFVIYLSPAVLNYLITL